MSKDYERRVQTSECLMKVAMIRLILRRLARALILAKQALRESLDTTTPGGKLIFHVFGAVAEFERDLIRERTMAGLEAARARGRKGGRKRSMDAKKVALASKLLKDRETPVSANRRGSP
jgi:DNA invertase Pin-like site-specific DNA recombinase